MRVLVVETLPEFAADLCRTLSDLGHEPLSAADAASAMTVLSSEPIDAVILAAGLPDGGAIEILQSQRVRATSLAVIVVAGEREDLEARECLRLGAFDLVLRPLSADRLREIFMYLHDRTLKWARPGESRERRRAARAPVEGAVTVIDEDGRTWQGQSVDASPFGVRIRAVAAPRGPAVTVEFTPPDDGPPIKTRALVVPREDGYALAFMALSDPEFRRLTVLVQRSLVRSPSSQRGERRTERGALGASGAPADRARAPGSGGRGAGEL